eukprot:149137-Pyramimonas_sp.AAC.1
MHVGYNPAEDRQIPSFSWGIGHMGGVLYPLVRRCAVGDASCGRALPLTCQTVRIPVYLEHTSFHRS